MFAFGNKSTQPVPSLASGFGAVAHQQPMAAASESEGTEGSYQEADTAAHLNVVRACYDVFSQVQHARMVSNGSAAVPFTFGNGNSQQAILHRARLSQESQSTTSPSQWSDQLSTRLMRIVDDKTTAIIWDLTTLVMSIHEVDGLANVYVSESYVEWFRKHFVPPFDNLTKLPALLHIDIPIEEFNSSIAGAMYMGVQVSIIGGHFQCAAAILDSIVSYVRTQGSSVFTADEESAMADVIRFLSEGWSDEESFLAWRSAANDEVYNARHVLTATSSHAVPQNTGNDMNHESQVDSAAADIKALCLDLLLVCSGDSVQLHGMCLSLGVDIFGFVAGVCAVTQPYMTLSELRQVYLTALSGDETVGIKKTDTGAADDACGSGLEQPWSTEFVRTLLCTDSLSEVVVAVELLSNTVDEGVLNDRFVLPSRDTPFSDVPLPFLCLQAMAAHVADLCAPSFTSTADDIEFTFTRNTLIENFVSLFQSCPELWKTAAQYLIFSPLSDPALLHRVVVDGTSSASSGSQEVQARLAHAMTFINTFWEETSTVQLHLRQELRVRLPESETLEKWIAALDTERRDAIRVLHHMTIQEHLASKQFASAVWLAIESQQTGDLHLHLTRALRQSDALHNVEIIRIGEAVSNGFVSIADAAVQCPEFAHQLRMCAVLSDIVKAHAALSPLFVKKTASSPANPAAGNTSHHHRPSVHFASTASGSHPHAQERSAKATTVQIDESILQRAEVVSTFQRCLAASTRALTYASDVEIHPSTTFSLIEFAVTLLLVETAATTGKSGSSSQHGRTASRCCGRAELLSTLSHALEVLLIENTADNSSVGSVGYRIDASQAMRIREDISHCLVYS